MLYVMIHIILNAMFYGMLSFMLNV